MNLNSKILIINICIITLTAHSGFSHCEIPCGIYDDEARINLLGEHITTIEKSINQIKALSAEKPVNQNQLVRWITNKEHHAEEFQHIVYQYFMTQRIKPADRKDTKNYSGYIKKLILLHEMLIYAMKSKQSKNLENVKKLRNLLSDFKKVYLGK
jgi:nickel superoxide dismutase